MTRPKAALFAFCLALVSYNLMSVIKAVYIRVADRNNSCRWTRSRKETATDQEVPAMRPYSMDLRERVVAAVDEAEGPQREIARLFRVSVSFVSRLLQRRRQKDTLAPEPHGGGPTPVLSPDDQRRLEDLIRDHNDDTLDQLRQQGGFDCSLTTIWRALRRCGLTSKKKTQHADERDRSDVREKRRSFRRKVKRVEPKRLVFVDETGVTTAMTRAYGWAPARRAGRRLGPRLVGVADRDRRVGD